MISPKARRQPYQDERRQGERKHLNKKFYNSKAWRDIRLAYLNRLRVKINKEIPNGIWTYNDMTIQLEPHQISYILSLDYLPCERCMILYLSGPYDTIDPGKELDHIKPINPEDALESEGYGDPFDLNNLMYLCIRHHARKSQRETKQLTNE